MKKLPEHSTGIWQRAVQYLHMHVSRILTVIGFEKGV
jgi:hypothetical protein